MENQKPRLRELRAWMKREGVSQTDLAKRLDWSQATISLYLNGKRNLSAENLAQLAEVTGIPVEKLSTGGEAAAMLKLLRRSKPARPEKAAEMAKVV